MLRQIRHKTEASPGHPSSWRGFKPSCQPSLSEGPSSREQGSASLCLWLGPHSVWSLSITSVDLWASLCFHVFRESLASVSVFQSHC